MKQQLRVLFSALLYLSFCLQASVMAETPRNIYFIYIHGANASEPEKELSFARDAKRLHSSLFNTFSKNTKIKGALGGEIVKDPEYIYWGDLVRTDSAYFKHSVQLTKSKGLAQKFRTSIQPIVYDALWLQNTQNNFDVLERIHKKITGILQKDPTAQFVLVSHSAGTLAAFDYVTNRLSLFDLNEYLNEEYGTKTYYGNNGLPPKACLSLMSKYGMASVSSAPSANPAFAIAKNLGDVLNKLVYESKTNELNEIKSILAAELQEMEKFLDQEQALLKNAQDDEFYVQFINNLQKFADDCKAESHRIDSVLNIESIISKKKDNIETMKSFIASRSERLKSPSFSIEKKQRIAQRINLAKQIVSSEEKSLAKIIKLKDSANIKKYIELTTDTQKYTTEFRNDMAGLCLPEDRIKGMITMGSPLTTFRSHDFQRLSIPKTATYKFLDSVFHNDAFWLHYNHQEDIIGVAIDSTQINKIFNSIYPKSQSVVVSAEDFSDSGSFFACRNISGDKCAHSWYFNYSTQLATGLERLFAKHLDKTFSK